MSGRCYEVGKKAEKIILWFEEITKEDIPLVGGKCANLGEMMKIGIPVPPGFAISAYAYKRFLEETGIGNIIYDILNTLKGKKEAYKIVGNLMILCDSESIKKDLNNISFLPGLKIHNKTQSISF